MVRETKVVDLDEALTWIREGRTYRWIVEEYVRKYNVETSQSMWRNLRSAHGIPRRLERNDDLMPWEIKPEHRHRHPAAMLRTEARFRAGLPVGESKLRMHASWKSNMEKQDAVVHYDPETEEGFFYVPRRPEIDKDLIRVPDRKTTKRRRDSEN